MSFSARQGLTARIRQMARTSPPQPASSGADDSASGAEAGGEAAHIRALQARIAELEHMVQGLQDAVFRESHRHEKRIEELEARTEPAALAVALSKNARERGL
jgi:TolA-binding protein